MTDENWWADMKGAATHWHELIAQAANVADLARAADPAKLPVTDDYVGALAELNHSLIQRALHEVDDATSRFLKAFNLSDGLKNVLDGDAGQNEAALLGALVTLTATKHELEKALARLPTFDDDEPADD